MTLKLTILGCGTSGGVPRIGNHWGACDPANPKNRRRRCSLLVERAGPDGTTTALVDTSPDLRQQLLDAGVGWLDGVLYTHDHADHVHGIDDLQMVSFNGRRRVDVYYDAATGRQLRDRFRLLLRNAARTASIRRSSKATRSAPASRSKSQAAAVRSRRCRSARYMGSGETLGFRFGGIAYSPDVSDFPEESLQALQDLDVWILDALRYTPHPSHLSVEQALAVIARVKPKRAVLTHMHVDLDYETLKRDLPDGVEPAYDGMVLETE